MRRLKKYLKDFISERSDDVAAKICYSNKKYKALNMELDEIQKEFTQELTEDAQRLTLKIEELQTAQSSIMFDGLYKQGLLDGVRIARTIEQLGREILCK